MVANEVEVVDTAIADLAVNPDDERGPDHRHIAVDIDRRVADALLEARSRRHALRKLAPAFLPQAARRCPRARSGDTAVGVNLTQHSRGIAALEGREERIDRRQNGGSLEIGRRQCAGRRQSLSGSQSEKFQPHAHYILKTPTCGRSGIGAFSVAAKASPKTSRVWAGSMIPSSHNRAVACQGLPCAS